MKLKDKDKLIFKPKSSTQRNENIDKVKVIQKALSNNSIINKDEEYENDKEFNKNEIELNYNNSNNTCNIDGNEINTKIEEKPFKKHSTYVVLKTNASSSNNIKEKKSST